MERAESQDDPDHAEVCPNNAQNRALPFALWFMETLFTLLSMEDKDLLVLDFLDGHTNFPGFRIAFGSSASLTVRCRAGFFGHGQRPPALFRDAHAVFASDRAAPREDLFEQIVERGFAALLRAGLVVIHHDVRVDVAVACVPKQATAMPCFFAGARRSRTDPPATARNDDISFSLVRLVSRSE